MQYKPLEEYSVIGGNTVALVGRDGSIDWCPFSHIESPSVFTALLDADRGGHFAVRPMQSFEFIQQYRDRTNVLETTFRTTSGDATVTDFVPVAEFDNNRDELLVGWPTLKSILGNRLIPRWLDHYLASSGYNSQQTDELVDPDRQHNLHEPLADDYGAHGPFDEQDHNRSCQLWMSMHRRILALITGFVVVVMGIVLGQRLLPLDSDTETETSDSTITYGSP